MLSVGASVYRGPPHLLPIWTALVVKIGRYMQIYNTGTPFSF
jgi:hypothetical protein